MKIFYEVSGSEQSKQAYKHYSTLYPPCAKDAAQVIVVIGGDGFMLRCLHAYTNHNVQLYGLNYGTVGFMMNAPSDNLIQSIETAKEHILHPLQAHTERIDDTNKTLQSQTLYGYNEVSIHRLTQQAIHIQISIQEKIRLQKLVCDGALVATPVGSTAYNLSAMGPVLPIQSQALALTPISPFNPRRWRGAVIPDNGEVLFKCLDTEKRPASVATDNTAVQNIKSVRISKATHRQVSILTDNTHDLEERIIAEQFQ